MSDDQLKALNDKFTVRMPDGLREKIAEAARKNGRSMNTEIIMRLEETLSPHYRPPIDYGILPTKDARRVIFEAVKAKYSEVLMREFESVDRDMLEKYYANIKEYKQNEDNGGE